MSEKDPIQRFADLRRKDPRYAQNAYIFAFQALDYTIKEHLKLPQEKRRHVTARELLEGMREYAVTQYGYLARHVWESWGVYGTSDWGAVIYNLIESELMSANAGDKVEDFRGIYEFKSAFDERWAFHKATSGAACEQA